MTDSDITTTILRQIRDELVGVRQGVEKTNERLDATVERLDRIDGRLDRIDGRLTVVEGVVHDAAVQVMFLGRYVKNKQDVAIADLRRRVGKLEKKRG